MAKLGEGRATKRRAGSAVGGLPVADPRPVFDRGAVLGARCTSCRYPTAQRELPWCPVCHAELAAERFAVTGRVWSSTVVAIPVGNRKPPFGLAYLDLDDGPRVLVHLTEASVQPPGSRMRVTGVDDGDLVAGGEVVS